MSKTEYKAEDFMLDPEFRHWVFTPDEESKIYWEDFLLKNPEKYEAIQQARKLLLNLSRDVVQVEESRIDETWENIAKSMMDISDDRIGGKIVPLSSGSTIERLSYLSREAKYHSRQLHRIAGILVVAFLFGLLFSLTHQNEVIIKEVLLVYEEHEAPPGVKSNLTLQDGTKIILNSGSRLKYLKNFELERREVFLIGEAYFDVAKDSLRPFSVRTGPVVTTAIGTSFNISAYGNERNDISLISGKVKVKIAIDTTHHVDLLPGETLEVEVLKNTHKVVGFESDRVLGWTKKTILFDRTPLERAIRVLENWYGVEIQVKNQPDNGVLLSGKFVDQTLKGVLEGLSFSTRFDFRIENDQVMINFN
ncbi:FecR family protein [Lunatibacter salilacus]|uniref:FecR family protein n=1 Tax=Lunatibacter salilacus TaxID=2483804 RepID=UPI00131CAC2E|nr:FecR family protein [Lunatibacter salilacus]